MKMNHCHEKNCCITIWLEVVSQNILNWFDENTTKGKMRHTVFSFILNEQLMLSPINLGQHEQCLGHRMTYSTNLRTENRTRFSIPKNILMIDNQLDQHCISFAKV